jgi:hypothetical protein
MTLELLDSASEAWKASQKESSTDFSNSDSAISCRDEIQAESSYLLAASASEALSSTRSAHRRTGRWTDEETEFVDFLVHAFDHGILPMAAGVRLNDFLCSLLLCKASRLTKKLKNAKLSARVYDIQNYPRPGSTELDCKMFTQRQEKFLRSVDDPATRWELRFIMDKAWRQNIYNLCSQVKYVNLNATAWLESLDAMENRAAEAEEKIRKARRAQMGLALKTDVRAETGVFFSGIPVQKPCKTTSSSSPYMSGRNRGDSFAASSTESSSENRHIATMLDHGHRRSSSLDDFKDVFDDLVEGTTITLNQGRPQASLRHHSGSFLDEVQFYMENHDLPFEHVDIWVPSYVPDSERKPENFRLFHAGHATRSDLDPALLCQLHEYGEYSTKFSFAPGVGLPGRVFVSGKPSWECRIDEADPKIFERAGGAKVYGIKTGVGIPLSGATPASRMVVAFYSIFDLHENPVNLEKWAKDLAAFCPQPEWKLVVKAGSQVEDMRTSASITGESTILHHYDHGARADQVAGSYSPLPAVLPANISDADRNISLVSLQSSLTVTGNSNAVANKIAREEEIRIATLLGDHMPGAEMVPPNGTAVIRGHDTSGSHLFPHFMSLRLLLLRVPERRSAKENDLIEIIGRSYRGYAKDGMRSKKELVQLLLQDWYFLNQTPPDNNGALKPASAAASAATASYQSHVMELSKNVQTFFPTGMPVSSFPPSMLGGNHPANAWSSSSPHFSSASSSASCSTEMSVKDEEHDAGPSKKRRISEQDDEILGSINIVDDDDF